VNIFKSKKTKNMEHSSKLVIFQEKTVRRVWYEEQWWFSISDVIQILTDSENPVVYWRVLKKRLLDEGANQTVTNCNGFKMLAKDGKMRKTDAANSETLLRLLMSIPSPKAEPFKLWLAQVGRQHIEEIENPELAVDRARELYKAKGYSEEWINARLKSIEVRQELTDEWQMRGVKEGIEYSILTAEISRATFGMTPSAYRDFKSLEKENLRDHMTNMELIFTMLGEEATRRFAKIDDAQGFNENHDAALKGGTGAGKALTSYEKETGDSVITPDNFLKQIKESQNKEELPPL
jgi:DNA-damage-inducible protein D